MIIKIYKDRWESELKGIGILFCVIVISITNYFFSGEFSLTSMFEILRDCDSDICRGIDHKHPTASSMVSFYYNCY